MKKEMKKKIEVDVDYLDELERDSAAAYDLIDRFNSIYYEIEDVLWKNQIGSDIDLTKVLENVMEEIDEMLDYYNQPPEE